MQWCARFLVLAFSCTDNAELAASLSFAIGKAHAGCVYDTCPQHDSHSSPSPGLSPGQPQAHSYSNYSGSSLQFRAALELFVKFSPGRDRRNGVHRKYLSNKVCAAVRAGRHASAAEKLQSCPLSPLCEEADEGASTTIAVCWSIQVPLCGYKEMVII